MNAPHVSAPKSRPLGDLRTALALAALMLLAPWAARLAARAGWGTAEDLSQRALLLPLAAFLVLTGNTIPKRIPLGRCAADPARQQSFYRFAGWTWVLTGLAFGAAVAMLPARASAVATFVILPLGIAFVALAWWRIRTQP